MMHLAIWGVVLSLLVAWSLCAGAAYTLAGWTAAQGGGLAGRPIAIGEWLASLGLDAWLPTAAIDLVSGTLAAAEPIALAALRALPMALAWLPSFVAVLWALGALSLVALGIAGSLLVRWLARRRDGSSPSAAS